MSRNTEPFIEFLVSEVFVFIKNLSVPPAG